MDAFREDPAVVAAHVVTLADQCPGEAKALADELFARCWPGGGEDRFDPVSVEWVRRWRRSTLVAARVECSCARRRCGICN